MQRGEHLSLGFGIVGCGMISRFHARAINEVAGAKLIGCTSLLLDEAQKFGAEFQCQPFASLHEMLADSSVNIVTICTPSGAHLDPAVAAANAGKHVLVEKPLEVTAARCQKIVDAAQRKGVHVATVFPSRFHNCWKTVKTAMDAGRFGTLSLGDAFVKWFRTQEYYDSGQWRGTWELDGGGALMNQAIHSVDLLLWLMGPVESVTAKVATRSHKRIEVEDIAVATLQFRSGALGVIEATTGSFPGLSKRIELHGSTGSVIVEEQEIKHWAFAQPLTGDDQVIRPVNLGVASQGGAGDPSSIGHAAHAEQFRNFMGAIQRGAEPAIAGAEGSRSVELIEAIYRSARENRAVVIP